MTYMFVFLCGAIVGAGAPAVFLCWKFDINVLDAFADGWRRK